MKSRVYAFISLASFIALSFASSAPADLKEYLFRQKQKSQQTSVTTLLDNAPAATPKPKEFDQLIDHFGGSTKTFKQRYWIDSQFVEKPKTAPVIYVICGEATCGGASDMEPINKEAKRLKAHLVALEHRYYGYSIPAKDLSAKNMIYLSQEQAIEDLARFQKFVVKTKKFQGKWIAVGGSYPGSLSAFYRMKHPELVVGALASSAPVFAKADFEEYDRHIAKVAGAQCLAQIQKTVAEVEKRLKMGSAESMNVRKIFKAEEVRDDRDFMYVIADMAAIAIQYGYQQFFCDALTKAGSDLEATLAAYGKAGTKLFDDFGITAVMDSFQGAESIDPKDSIQGFGMRSWMYQSCTQFGYYQIANSDPAMSSRSSMITESYHDEVCERLYGIKKKVDASKTNREWYENLFNKKTTNIFFTNGSNDPWSNLSILDGSAEAKRNLDLSYMTINGQAHCSDLTSKHDSEIQKAQAALSALIDLWLK